MHSKPVEKNFFVDGDALHYTSSIQDLEPSLFWNIINQFLTLPDWKFLILAPEETIDRKKLELFSLLPLDIAPLDLIELKSIKLNNLQELVDAQLPPLHVATYLGSIPLMESVFDNGKELNTVYTNEKSSFNQYFPLLMAFTLKHYNAFEWLLKKEASFGTIRGDLLKICYQKEQYRPFAPLLIKYQFLEHQFKTVFTPPVHKAAEEGDKQYLQFLVNLGAPFDVKDFFDQTPLSLAIENNQIDIVAYFLSLNLTTNATHLKHAFKNPLVLSLLLENGTNFSNYDLTNHLSNPSISELLLKYSNNIKWECYSLSMLNSVVDYPEVLNLFLKNSAYLCQSSLFEKLTKNFLSLEIFTYATEDMDKALHALLTYKDFNINICDTNDTPLFHLVIKSENVLLIQKALAHPFLDKTALDKKGVSALQLAVCMNNIEITQLLLENGFEVNQSCSSDLSPLHIAADKGNLKMVLLLLTYGANRTLKTRSGYLPITYALKYNKSLINLLKQENEFSITTDSVNICDYPKQFRLPLTFQWYKQINPKTKSLYKEMLIIKFLAHIFELKASIEIHSLDGKNNHPLCLEGMSSNRWLYSKFKKVLLTLEKDSSFPSTLREVLLDLCLFFESAASKTDKDFYDRFHDKKPLPIETGYRKHNVIFFFQKISESEAIFGVGNRHHPITIFRINPCVLTEELIDEIRAYTTRPLESYNKLLNKLQYLSTKDEGLNQLADICPLKNQIVGNCVQASWESGALWLTIALQCAKEGKGGLAINELFSCLMLEIKLHFSSQYFASHLKSDNAFFPDMPLCHIIHDKIGSYSKPLRDQHKELSIQFRTIPWKHPVEDTEEERDDNMLSFETLRKTYYR